MAALAIATTPVIGAMPMAAGGGEFSLALHRDGTVRTWGNDDQTQLAARQIVVASPRRVEGVPAFTAVSLGLEHTLALTAQGTIWSWGSNKSGQLGSPERGYVDSLPALVPDLTGVIAIAAGQNFSLALKSDGTVWGWGMNQNGTLGDGTNEDRLRPTQVAGLAGVSAIAAGEFHSMALRSDGTLWTWGDNVYGQLGDGTRERRSTPVRVIGITGTIVGMAGGYNSSVAVNGDGTVLAWGINGGDNTQSVDRLIPGPVAGLSGVASVATYSYGLALLRDGTVMRFGNGLENPQPSAVGELNAVAAVATGNHGVALLRDGSVWAWGDNTYGQLGNGTTARSEVFQRVQGIGPARAIAAGYYNTAVVGIDGRLWILGVNNAGQAGDGASVSRSTPGVARGLSAIRRIAAGFTHAVAIDESGRLWAWGGNTVGQVGDGTFDFYRPDPQVVPGVDDVVRVAARESTYAVTGGGNVFAFGGNQHGELGNGRTEERNATPALVAGLGDVIDVAAGNSFALALRRDGSVWSWGRNDRGQLGNGTTTSRSSAAPIEGLSGVVALAAGATHSAALKSDGTVWVWGDNEHRQLFDSNAAVVARPSQVPGLGAVTGIAAGANFTLALRSDGTVASFGLDPGGALGRGRFFAAEGVSVPGFVLGLPPVVQVAAGESHGLAVAQDGSVYAWGANSNFQLGDGTLVDRNRAVAVLREGGAGGIVTNDWFLDLEPGVATAIPGDLVPPFLVVASGSAQGIATTVSADIRYRQQDLGTTASTFAFALAPASLLRGAALKDADPRIAWKARDAAGKAGEVQCALAQLNAQGQLVAVSAASLQAYVSGVLSAQGQSVSVLNGTPTTAVAGATFFVGYGPTGEAMLTNGTTRSVVSVPGGLSCQPQPPQTGWWYNPAEGGRGFSIEARGNRLFFAAFHYEADGRATWNFAGGATSLDGSLFTSNFLAASGGQALTGPYRLPGLANAGNVTFAFSDATHGTMIWPGGTVAIERQPFVPDGLTAAPQAGLPESGWWWNPDESGRGFFIEWQGGFADIAGYMYDAQGRPTWYISALPTPDPLRITGNWWTFANGQAMGQPYRAATRTSDNAGALDVQFSSSTTATMTLPDGRRIPLVRQAF